MGSDEEMEALLARMTRGEKTQLLQRIARELGDAFPGIDVTEGVAGGDPCIARTRIPVWTPRTRAPVRIERCRTVAVISGLAGCGSGQRMGVCACASCRD